MSETDEPARTDPRALDDTIQDAGPLEWSPNEVDALTTISRYLVIETLGAGAMGVVLRAYDPRLRREVALKLLQRREEPDAEARMLREAQSMAQLSHPNVVGIYDAETTERGVMIAMELVVGVPLNRWLAERPRSIPQILAAFVQAGRGLAAAHAAGLIHRDFKPANVFVGSDGERSDVGRIRVGDFGLAREITPAVDDPDDPDAPVALELTATGMVMGTPVYMAPEQHLGRPADARSDQFAFCVSLWEALHGERPFDGSQAMALAYAKHKGEIRPPRAAVPAAVQAAIRRGLSADPDDRWPDLPTLLERLEPPRRRWSVLALVATIAAAGTVTTAVVTADTTSPHQARCAAAQGQLAATWNDEIRAGLEADQRGSPRLMDALDAYAYRLRDHYHEICQTTDPPDAQRFDLTMTCLDQRIQQIDATVELLWVRTVQSDKHVAKIIDKLTPIDRCAQTRWIGARRTLPEDPQLRPRVVALRNDIARIKRLEASGQRDEAIALADNALARAEASGFWPILSDLLFARSSLAKAQGRFEDAARMIYRVLELRLSVGDDEGALAAAIDLVFIRGVRQDRYNEADGWAALARGLMGKTDIGPLRRGWLDNHVGASMNARGRPADALDPLRRAVDALSSGLGPDHKSVADPLAHLASALMALGRANEALVIAQRAVELRAGSFAPGAPALTTALLILARAQAATGAYALALQTLKRALEPLESDQTTEARRAEIWRTIADVHALAGDAAEAVTARARAEDLTREPNP
ncbi:MAG: protein kinase [Myxococcota bacterium]